MTRSTKLELVVSFLPKMQEQKLRMLFSCLVGFVTVTASGLKSGCVVPADVGPKVTYTLPNTLPSVPRIPIEPVDVILKQQSEIKPDGSYNWSYETQNGIKAEEKDTTADLMDSRKVATGSFEYTARNGTLIAVTDENDFLTGGAHLPTPPPIPVEIDRALKRVASHPQSNK